MPSSWDQTQIAPGAQAAPASGSAWDTTPAVAPAQVPFDDPGILKSILIGAGRTFDQIGKGAKQVYYGVTGNTQGQQQLAKDAASDDAVYAPLQQARPFSTGTGEALPAIIGAGGGGATLGATMLRQAVASAAPSLLSYGSASDRLKGAGWNAAGAVAVPLLGVAGKTAYAAAEPFWQGGQDAIIGRTLNNVAGPDASTAMANMLHAAPLVPGSFPTAGQVANNGGIAALERSASAVNPTAYADRQMQQLAARRAALLNIAGPDGALEAAQDLRSQVANSTYGYARQVGPDPAAYTPAAQANIAAMQARVPPSALSYAQDIARLKGEPMNNSTVIGGMQYTKEALGDLANNQNNGPAMSNALTGLASDFNAGLRQISPLHAAADDIFSEMSQPINQMAVGRALYDRAVPALGREGQAGAPVALARETANNFANALENPAPLVKKATNGFASSLEDVLSPQQIGSLQNVRADMARTANAGDLGRGVGSDTIQKLAMQNIATQSGMPSIMGALTKTGAAPLSWVYADANHTLAQKMADALLNPQQAAGLMSNAAPAFMAATPKLKNLMAQTLLRSSMLAKPTGATADQVLTPALTAE
jgi:hypothetical protein